MTDGQLNALGVALVLGPLGAFFVWAWWHNRR